MIKGAFEKLLNESVLFNKAVGVLNNLAKDGLALVHVVTQLRKDVNMIAEHVRVHQIALEKLVTAANLARQQAAAEASEASKFDTFKISEKGSNTNKPN